MPDCQEVLVRFAELAVDPEPPLPFLGTCEQERPGSTWVDMDEVLVLSLADPEAASAQRVPLAVAHIGVAALEADCQEVPRVVVVVSLVIV